MGEQGGSTPKNMRRLIRSFNPIQAFFDLVNPSVLWRWAPLDVKGKDSSFGARDAGLSLTDLAGVQKSVKLESDRGAYVDLYLHTIVHIYIYIIRTYINTYTHIYMHIHMYLHRPHIIIGWGSSFDYFSGP